ncbi:DUF2252 family protein [Arthrobacter sp. zg-Y1171]|uniref:DUF2252 family protein n=1 Tax=Arthrobacter sp. zg-Y1171 TaxID=2964610 RepID=UPI00210557AB|nr:DUF2252 family protein [Arthrobacter sp. zg-Y1171]UWX83490.1 DUF2252 domain-containing protein [Arthrobacter sp. zg-Y1171]
MTQLCGDAHLSKFGVFASPERILLFDNSVTDFCERYADQNEQDYQTFADAVRSGRLPAVEGV